MSGHGFERQRRDVSPRQQVVYGAVWVVVDDLSEDAGEIGVWVDAVELAGFDQRRHPGPVLSAAIGASEERILAIESDRPDRSFYSIGADLDFAVFEESGEAFPMRESTADRLGELALLADEGRSPEERCATPLGTIAIPLSPNLSRGWAKSSPPDVFLDRVDERNALQRLGRDRRGVGDGAFIEATLQ